MINFQYFLSIGVVALIKSNQLGALIDRLSSPNSSRLGNSTSKKMIKALHFDVQSAESAAV